MKSRKYSLEQIQLAREELLEKVVDFYSTQQSVVGLLLVGSIPNGTADAFSDIDLRVLTTSASHPDFLTKRLEIPLQWGELLYNEWTEGTEVCVSHFRSFLKIDVFYWNADELEPSAWFNLSSTVLLDRNEVLKNFLAQCAAMEFDKPTNREISRVVSKALACAHESLRRSRRGELFYAQSMLERVRAYTVQMEDWINRFEPIDSTDLKLEKRISGRLKTALESAYPPLDALQIENSLIAICVLMSEQIVDLHSTFSLDRDLTKDQEALELILYQQIEDTSQSDQ